MQLGRHSEQLHRRMPHGELAGRILPPQLLLLLVFLWRLPRVLPVRRQAYLQLRLRLQLALRLQVQQWVALVRPRLTQRMRGPLFALPWP